MFATLEENLKSKGVKQAKELIKRFITTYNWDFRGISKLTLN